MIFLFHHPTPPLPYPVSNISLTSHSPLATLCMTSLSPLPLPFSSHSSIPSPSFPHSLPTLYHLSSLPIHSLPLLSLCLSSLTSSSFLSYIIPLSSLLAVFPLSHSILSLLSLFPLRSLHRVCNHFH